MTIAADTWIVVADGAGARVFEERRRLGPLAERAELAVRSREDRRHVTSHRATVTDRMGFGRHGAGDVDIAARAEQRFLASLAERLEQAALDGEFEHLVIVAPPVALGKLRAALKPATARRIEVCDPRERRVEDIEALRARLQALRAAS